MSLFIEAETDPFVAERMSMREDYQAQFRNNANIRRPTRGHVLKEDSYAVLRVMDSTGNFIPVLDAAGEEIHTKDGKAYTTYYSNFFVQTVNEQRAEKQQIVETFGETYIFFFGESPRFVNIQGMLLNTADFNWRDEFWENYEKYFRGTRLVERGARLYLIYDEVIVEGYMVNANATESAQNPWVMPFTFQMFVTGQTALSNIGDPTIPWYDSGRTYGGSEDEYGYWDAETNQWITKDEYYGVSFASSAVGMSINRILSGATGGSGDVKLLTDALRTGTATHGDPASSNFTQAAAAAAGNEDRIEFRPNPRTDRGRFYNNEVEFVQRASNPQTREDEFGSSDECQQSADAIDSAVTSETGDPSITTDPEYADLMGRSGCAQNEINESGGSRLQGEGIRNDLGGSDLPSSQETRSSSSRPQRDTPYGLGVVDPEYTRQPAEFGALGV